MIARRSFAALLLLAIAAAPTTAPASHTFKYTPAAGSTPKSVDVAGDFNGWSTTATPLTKGADGTYAAKVDLTAGRHAYKFVVDGAWTNDPAADPAMDAADGLGGHNSGVDVTAAVPHTFTSSPPAGTTSVAVAGDFNAWSTTATPLAKKADGTFAATVGLTGGIHPYKFVVNGSRWIEDPKADKALAADDGQGGKNSGVDVEPPPAGKR